MTSLIVRAAAFAAPVPNFLADRGHAKPLDHIPHLYYCDAIEGKDALGGRIDGSNHASDQCHRRSDLR